MEGELWLDERVPPFRIKEGKKHSPSPWIYIILVLFFMGILLVLFLQSPLSRVKQVYIVGNKLVSDQQVRTTSGLRPGVSFLHTDPRSTQKKLVQLPEIKQAEIVKTFPNTVQINIHEFPVLAYIQSNDGRFVPVLSTGQILPKHRTTRLIDQWPVINLQDHKNPTIQLALQNLARVPFQIRKQVEFVQQVPGHADQVKLLTKLHHQVYVRAKDLHKKLVYYPQFESHPQGTLYLLDSIWFRPGRNTDES